MLGPFILSRYGVVLVEAMVVDDHVLPPSTSGLVSTLSEVHYQHIYK